MNRAPLKTVLVGCGKIGAAYAKDSRTAQHFRYATHAQVLADHPAFAWQAVVDQNPGTLRAARQQWTVEHVCASIEQLPKEVCPDVAVLATQPGQRLELLRQLPSVRAVIVEKPLGATLQEAEQFLEFCREKKVLIQVNFWRRADALMRSMAHGKLEEWLGRAQAVFGVYGNGLINNGSHLIDLVRMFFGEVASFQAVGHPEPCQTSMGVEDWHFSFHLEMENGVTVAMQPVDFNHYRENALDIWGEKGRLCLMNEGLEIFTHPLQEHRALQGAREISMDARQAVSPTASDALYRLYDNLASAMQGDGTLWSSGDSAFEVARIVQNLIEAAKCGAGRAESWRMASIRSL